MHPRSPYRLVWTAAFAAFALLAVACAPGEEEPAGEAAPPAQEGAEAPAAEDNDIGDGAEAVAELQQGDATITGTVTFTGTPPTLPTIAMDADPDCAAKHGEPVYAQTLVLGGGGTVGNIFVQVKDGFAQGDYPPPTTPVVVDQEGCMYNPHVVGVLAGQPLEFWNSDGILHNVHLTPKQNREQNLGMPGSLKEKAVTLNTPELYVPVKCDVHPWMSAFVAVMSHPYFDVTEDDGRYEIQVPAGTYTIESWHERLGTRTQEVTVAAGETATVDFALDVPAQ
jgi:plastocyanin